jgi:hypothetical protein
MSKKRGNRELRKPKQVKKEKAEISSVSQPGTKGASTAKR